MVDKALENAKEIAELTGRTTKEVIADILDDGVLNNSIQENTSAIDKATETAQKLQKLLTAIIPILVLLAGSGLELGGIIDLTPAGEGDDDWAWEDDYEYPEPVRYGCTDSDALNYDEYAEEDDGTCEYDEPEPEPEPEVECEPFFYDNWTGYKNNQTQVFFEYDVDINCDETQDVTVQFLVYEVNSTHGDAPSNYSIDDFQVYNADYGYRNITLGNFTTGQYDVYAYLINDDGEMITELKWMDIEIKGDE